MQGIITVHDKRYVFRNADDGVHRYFAWEAGDGSCRSMCYKWKKVRGQAELFNIDNPPATVSYVPSLALFV